jgi:uncharacterized repeat protein (TIGR03803 family)
MAKLEALGPFALVSTKGRKACGAGKSSLLKLACISIVFCVVAASAQTFKVLKSFNGSDGVAPEAPLIQATDGNFYGTTAYGGDSGCRVNRTFSGCGTVFKITPGGTLTALHSFDGADGASSSAGLVLAIDGNLYGTTTFGGGSDCEIGCGTVFKITLGGTLTTLHSFDGADGDQPNGALIQGVSGSFFGTTEAGGAYGFGTVFKVIPSGTLTTQHSFDGTDGVSPVGLLQAADGNFYGTTSGGGAEGDGTVFRVTPDGTLTTLHSFDGTDGAGPVGLLQATNGNFYGTTSTGGPYNENCNNNGCGTVFEITPSGKLTTLHSFGTQANDGWEPNAGLVQANDGNFYGTTLHGGAYEGPDYAQGTAFKITPTGVLTTLASFCLECSAGTYPWSALMQATNGTLYGTTLFGGFKFDGDVFSLSGLAPFVAFLPAARRAGGLVEILGQGFTGTTAVSFNGTPASFIVESDTYLTATVPAGASTGVVTVTTPSGTLTSNKTFRVVPQITSFSPTSGPVSTSVVITGESFIGVIDVHFGNVKVTSFTVDSDTQITATVPAGAETGKISVCTAGGSGDSATSFTVTP